MRIKGGNEMSKEVKKEVGNKKEISKKVEMKEVKEVKENKKGGNNMKEVKEVIKEIETKKLLLIEKVIQWTESLSPVKDVHIKIKGRYYPLLEKETGKLYLIDRVQGKKVPFDTLEDQNMKFVISAVLAERKEQIEKEVKEDKRKYLEGKLKEVDELLNKF